MAGGGFVSDGADEWAGSNQPRHAPGSDGFPGGAGPDFLCADCVCDGEGHATFAAVAPGNYRGANLCDDTVPEWKGSAVFVSGRGSKIGAARIADAGGDVHIISAGGIDDMGMVSRMVLVVCFGRSGSRSGHLCDLEGEGEWTAVGFDGVGHLE